MSPSKFKRLFPLSIAFWVLSIVFQSCLFSTKELRTKPAEINSYGQLFQSKNAIEYSLTGQLGQNTIQQQKIVFQIQDSSQSASTLLMRIYSQTDQSLIFSSQTGIQLDSQGIVLDLQNAGETAHFFPMKITSGNFTQTKFQSLPEVLQLGYSWTQDLGDFTHRRELISLDTLEYKDKLEETWKIEEKVFFEEAEIYSSTYWFGASGLLKNVTIWKDFSGYDPSGNLKEESDFVRTLKLL